jgi:hypothetical protein
MTDLDHRAEPCTPVTLSNKKAPSPIRACSHPHPPGSGRLEAAHSRRTADCRSHSQPAWQASTTSTPRPAPFVHADLKRE